MSENKTVRIGVIGLGNIGRQHIDNIRNGLVAGGQLSAVCSRSAKDSEYAQQLEVPHFTEYEAMIDSGLCDAVVVAAPTFQHADMGQAALRAGLHVMMEKPLGLSVKEGEDLLQLHTEREEGGQLFALMLNQRADPLFTKMREVIVNGTLGEITRTHWTMTNWFRPEIYFQVSDWRATWAGEGGGLLLNQCIHNLDIFQWLCAMPVSLRAHCRMGRYHAIEVEDEATAFFEYANGASGVFVGSTGEAPGVNRFDIVGDLGNLSFDGERLMLTQNSPGTAQFNRETQEMFGMPESVVEDITPDRTGNQHASVLSNFCAAILRGEALLAPAREGMNSLALANAMLLSTWEDAAISLPLDSARYHDALRQKMSGSTLREKSSQAAKVDMNASYR